MSPAGAPAASLAIAAVTLAIQNGVVMAFAVIYLPLVAELGASRADVAVVHSTVLLIGGVAAPLVGWAFDRLGPRRLFQGGGLLAALGLVLASQAASMPVLLLGYGVVAGLGLAALGSQVNMIVAALWYPRSRGRAVALVDLGTGLGAFAFVPLGQALVEAVGWRGALLAWAALLAVVLVPLNGWQRLPALATPAVTADRSEGSGWTTAAALRSAPFWWLAAMRFAGAVAFPLMNTHMVAFAVGHGIGAATAATALGAVSLVSLAGRLGTGLLCDRLGRAPTLTVTYASAALGVGCLVALAATGAPAWLAAYVVLYGLAQGSSGIVASARAADVFAGRSFGAIWGWLGFVVGPGEALGAWAGGKVFDATGSYLPAFGLVVGALAAGVIAVWRVRSAAGTST